MEKYKVIDKHVSTALYKGLDQSLIITTVLLLEGEDGGRVVINSSIKANLGVSYETVSPSTTDGAEYIVVGDTIYLENGRIANIESDRKED